MESEITAPILLIAFNRPDTTRIVFDKIRNAKPLKLYVAVDGPRKNKEGEDIRVNEVRNIVKNVDWECEFHFLFRDLNLGCGIGVSSAITWAFETTDKLIIIEDDCLPAMPFFAFCNILLEKYKDDTRICMISGNNYTEKANKTDDSYFFSKYGHIWGWATWKRTWDKYDFEMIDWPSFRNTNQICNVFRGKKEQRFFLTFYNNFLAKKEKGTWDYQWFYCRIKDNGLSIVPSQNLVTNIGVQGVHTGNKSEAHFSPVNEDFRINKEPQFILCNAYYDKQHFTQWINKKSNFLTRIIRKLVRTISEIR